jgi:hypothetical protein
VEIKSPNKFKTIRDIAIVFASGFQMDFQLDLEAGDTLEDNGDRLLIHLVAKPSINPDVTIPAETIVVIKTSLAVVKSRDFQVKVQTHEEQQKFLESLET